MNDKPDHTEIFQLHYSYYLEHMTEGFNRRVFNFVSFVQVVMGGTIMADFTKGLIPGLVITLLSAFMFVYKPGEIASKAKQQSKRYERLINRLPSITRDELVNSLSDSSEFDSSVPGSLTKPAYIRAAISTGSDPDTIDKEIMSLGKLERVYTFISGGIPH
ncbi:hypothetical protein [Erwinia sp. LJJL01]|uniref:hypothetical protein n=1 Tax=Erwinia sp. LJJL01 TaxID=3391839 RepID=UPI001060DBBD